MIYIHFGHNSFDKNKFKPIKNLNYISKPSGGLWASRLDSKYGWEKWAKNNEIDFCDLTKSFQFKISNSAKILTIDNVNKLKKLPLIKKDLSKEIGLSNQIDFEKLAMKYDAIEVLISKDEELYFALYGWDCDSILVLNPNVIITYKNKELQPELEEIFKE